MGKEMPRTAKPMDGVTPHNLAIRRHLLKQDFASIAELWEAVRWGCRDQEDVVRRALAASQWIAIAEIDGQFAGYGRALSDGVIATYLTEVAVVPSLRRKGVGTALVLDCLENCKVTSVYADASPEMLPLLKQLGIVPRPRYLTACSKGPEV